METDSVSTEAALRWRGRFLVVDEWPDVHRDAYLALAAQAQHFEIETGYLSLFERLQGTSPPYTLVLAPLVASGRLSAPDEFVGESLERWAARNAPGYSGRFLYYGPADLVRTAPAEAPVVRLPARPSPEDIERLGEAIDAAIERVRAQLRAQREADQQARRAARQGRLNS